MNFTKTGSFSASHAVIRPGILPLGSIGGERKRPCLLSDFSRLLRKHVADVDCGQQVAHFGPVVADGRLAFTAHTCLPIGATRGAFSRLIVENRGGQVNFIFVVTTRRDDHDGFFAKWLADDPTKPIVRGADLDRLSRFDAVVRVDRVREYLKQFPIRLFAKWDRPNRHVKT